MIKKNNISSSQVSFDVDRKSIVKNGRFYKLQGAVVKGKLQGAVVNGKLQGAVVNGKLQGAVVNGKVQGAVVIGKFR